MRLTSERNEDALQTAGPLREQVAMLQWQRGLYPPGPTPMRIGFRTVDGVRIRYAESSRAWERTLVLTSPWPESIYAFAPIWAALRRHFHLLAIDLPGFGASERRADLLSPRAMSEFLIRVIDDFGLDHVHLVAPDVGASAALFAAASYPQVIASLTVGSGTAAAPLELEPPRAMVDATLDTIARALPAAIRADYLGAYAGDRLFESLRYVQRYTRELPILARLLPQILNPVQIIAGEYDRFVPASNGVFLAERLPNSQLVTVDAGHFVWEDAPDRYASLVANWATGSYQTLRGRR